MININNPNELLRSLKSLSGPFPSFDVNLLPETPGKLFLQWLNLAIENGVKEPHAMTLSTVDADGYPDARVLILKNVVNDAFYFASGFKSRKGQQLKRNPQAAITFYWPMLGRQIRLRGTVEDMGDEAGAADFLQRSEEARAVALTGNQSRELVREEELEDSLAKQRERISHDPNITTLNWRLYAVNVKEAEFWQGDTHRKHIRVQYYWSEGQWKHRKLWP
ncbi:pyridoxine/pyridoxamine 5'-phosphate oxidase [Paenibacillus guangzhouensis]|uniref:pyridoxine/pyridoxamine 5'-phosphate oxidase n=1 Tax=Paenibacillus guangzhouensis TaxID=1473112 RepID=UPI001266A386|nr:pyridoxal 5'-phosphate synthase [Paenibacillus guangzhouensis]